MGIGTGVIFAIILEGAGMDDTVYPALIFLFGGAGLLIGFFISNKIAQKENPNITEVH
jgi:uncharacterized protein YneF (UPF0154 family)